MNSIDIIKYLETLYPKQNAYDWDNVGIQVGSPNNRVRKVLITLDVTKEVVQEAIDQKVELIISHHPLIFKPILNVQTESPRGWIIQKLIKHNICLYSMHTNYDVTDGGMNDHFASLLGLVNTSLLDDVEGIGRIGDLSNPLPFDEFVQLVKTLVKQSQIKLIGNARTTIRRVAFSLGSGSQHFSYAKKKGADLYLTGDVTYHTALDAEQMGYTILDISHYAEVIFKDNIQSIVKTQFPDIEILSSIIDTNPYQTI